MHGLVDGWMDGYICVFTYGWMYLCIYIWMDGDALTVLCERADDSNDQVFVFFAFEGKKVWVDAY